jgi:ketosteroid isomerase-like protein
VYRWFERFTPRVVQEAVMRLRFALICLILLCSALSGPRALAQRVRSDQEILTQLEIDWDEALRRRDVKFIDTLLADEFMVTYAEGGRADKAKELTVAAAFNQQIDSSTLDEFTVKIFGDTAVVWFTQHLVGPSQGRPLALTFRYLDIWVLRDGRWQCVASQATKVLS